MIDSRFNWDFALGCWLVRVCSFMECNSSDRDNAVIERDRQTDTIAGKCIVAVLLPLIRFLLEKQGWMKAGSRAWIGDRPRRWSRALWLVSWGKWVSGGTVVGCLVSKHRGHTWVSTLHPLEQERAERHDWHSHTLICFNHIFNSFSHVVFSQNVFVFTSSLYTWLRCSRRLPQLWQVPWSLFDFNENEMTKLKESCYNLTDNRLISIAT